MVSILILLELPFDNIKVHGNVADQGFQSLFYWNCRLIKMLDGLVAECLRFNPYFIGIAV